MTTTREKQSGDATVGIVGAGLSGIILAIHLKKAGFNDFVIYERDEDIGGTWLSNAYPGCRCDVPVVWYSLSTHPNPNWTQSHPPQSEILQYWMDIVEKENLRPHIRLNTAFVSGKWDAEGKKYDCVMEKGASVHTPVTDPGKNQSVLEKGNDVTLEVEKGFRGGKKERFDVSHNVLVQAIGGFSIPLVPNIKGLRYNAWQPTQTLSPSPSSTTTSPPTDSNPNPPSSSTTDETFQGLVIHPARWPRKGLDLRGKKVAIVGNGCSGTQIVHALSADREIQLYPIIRNAQWYLKRQIVPVPESRKALYRRFPLLQRLVRFLVYLRMDFGWLIFKYKMGGPIRGLAEKQIRADMRARAPEGFAESLIPKYPLGTKRIVNDMGFINALSLPNVEPLSGSIERFTKNSILFTNGRDVPVDVIVIATGFDTTGSSLDITGVDGMTLAQASMSSDSKGVYHGIGVDGLPNLFALLNANTAPSHASVIIQLEVQAGYIRQLICGMRDEHISVLEVKSEANKKYNSWLDTRLADTVWMHGPSFYRGGKNRDGKVFTNWPSFVAEYWWQNTSPIWSDWVGAEKLAAKQSQNSIRRQIMMVVTAVVLFYGTKAIFGIRA